MVARDAVQKQWSFTCCDNGSSKLSIVSLVGSEYAVARAAKEVLR